MCYHFAISIYNDIPCNFIGVHKRLKDVVMHVGATPSLGMPTENAHFPGHLAQSTLGLA